MIFKWLTRQVFTTLLEKSNRNNNIYVSLESMLTQNFKKFVNFFAFTIFALVSCKISSVKQSHKMYLFCLQIWHIFVVSLIFLFSFVANFSCNFTFYFCISFKMTYNCSLPWLALVLLQHRLKCFSQEFC